jgi:hypothetical protein
MKYTDDRWNDRDAEPMTDEEREAEREEVEAILIEEGQRAGREARERGGIDRNLPTEPDADDPFQGC